MKIRNGFVSNSSSSSFILFKNYLTADQIKCIKEWKTYAISEEYKRYLEDYAKDHKIEPHIEWSYDYCSKDQRKKVKVKPFSEEDYPYYPIGWTVTETWNVFDISTDMNNYNMRQYLETLGVDIDKCGMVIHDGHCDVLGLNDFQTDVKNYLNDSDYFHNYDEKYWYTSKDYKKRVYPLFKEMYDNSLKEDGTHYLSEPVEPKKRRTWICEDVERAFSEFEKKLNDFAIAQGYYLKGIVDEGNEKGTIEVFDKIFEILNEVKDNWKAVDDFESDIDESQLVISNIEGEGYFNKEDEKAYNEAINKLSTPIGVSVSDLYEKNKIKPEDC